MTSVADPEPSFEDLCHFYGRSLIFGLLTLGPGLALYLHFHYWETIITSHPDLPVIQPFILGCLAFSLGAGSFMHFFRLWRAWRSGCRWLALVPLILCLPSRQHWAWSLAEFRRWETQYMAFHHAPWTVACLLNLHYEVLGGGWWWLLGFVLVLSAVILYLFDQRLIAKEVPGISVSACLMGLAFLNLVLQQWVLAAICILCALGLLVVFMEADAGVSVSDPILGET